MARTTFIVAKTSVISVFTSLPVHVIQVMRKIGARLDTVSGLAVSPDRQTFLYSILVHHESDLMLIENFR